MPVIVSVTVFLAVLSVCVVTFCWCKLRDQISSYETRQRMPDFRTAFSGAFSWGNNYHQESINEDRIVAHLQTSEDGTQELFV